MRQPLLVQLAVYALGVLAQRARVAVLHVAAEVDAQAAVAPQRLGLLRAARLRARQVHAAQLAPPYLNEITYFTNVLCVTRLSRN